LRTSPSPSHPEEPSGRAPQRRGPPGNPAPGYRFLVCEDPLAEADDKQAADALERAVKRLKEQAKPDDGAKDYFGR
jgi:hypothetical protein